MRKILLYRTGLFFVFILVIISSSCRKTDLAANSSTGSIHYHQGKDGLALINVIQTHDGGFLAYCNDVSLGGSMASASFEGSLAFIRYDAAGHELWYRKYKLLSEFNALSEMNDGSFLVSCVYNLRYAGGAIWWDYHIFKIDANGNIAWNKAPSGSALSNISPYAFVEDKNGNYYMTGTAAITPSGSDTNYLLKVNNNGDPVRVLYYPTDTPAPNFIYSNCGSMFTDADGSFVFNASGIYGYNTGTNLYGLHMVRLDTLGHILAANKVFMFPSGYNMASLNNPIKIMPNGGYSMSFNLTTNISSAPIVYKNLMYEINVDKNFHLVSTKLLDSISTGGNIQFLKDDIGNLYEILPSAATFPDHGQAQSTFVLREKDASGTIIFSKTFPGSASALFLNSQNHLMVWGTSLIPLSDYTTVFTMELDKSGQLIN